MTKENITNIMYGLRISMNYLMKILLLHVLLKGKGKTLPYSAIDFRVIGT